MAWIAASELDLDAAARAIEAIDDEALRERLGSDLKALEPMARHEVSSEATYESLGDMTVWFTVGETSDGRPASAALHRLGAAGVLASAGALTWSPPVP